MRRIGRMKRTHLLAVLAALPLCGCAQDASTTINLRPFCTHEGSGLGGSVRAIKKALPAATVADGLAIQGQTAQNDRPAAQSTVDRWLGK